MKQQDFNAIILSGGSSSRMRIATDIPKQLLPIYNNKTLLQHQIEWLRSSGIENIILAIDSGTHEYIVDHLPYLLKMAEVSVEMEKLGTGGAIKQALNLVTSEKIYVMNVDDFILSDFYTPDELVDTIDRGFSASILTSRGSFPYGVIRSRGRRVIKFEQKPMMDFKVSTGHYAFDVGMIRSRFHPMGDFEGTMLPVLAKEKVLTFMDLDGVWATTNTWKELINARQLIKSHYNRKLYGSSRPVSDIGFAGYGKIR